MPLPDNVVAALSSLSRDSQSVAAVMGTGGDENRFTRALEALELLAHKHQIPLAIVGGLGAIHYGYPAVTEDIDIAVAKDDLAGFIKLASQFGFHVAWEAETG